MFRGREEKSQQRGNTLPYPLVCKETDIKLTIKHSYILKNIHFGSNKRLSNGSVHTLFTFCGSSLRNRKFIARMSLFNHRFRIQLIISRGFVILPLLHSCSTYVQCTYQHLLDTPIAQSTFAFGRCRFRPICIA